MGAWEEGEMGEWRESWSDVDAERLAGERMAAAGVTRGGTQT